MVNKKLEGNMNNQTEKWNDYSTYERDTLKKEMFTVYFQQVFKSVCKHIGNIHGKRMLDIGCGDGTLSYWLSSGRKSHEIPLEVIGMDLSERNLDEARNKGYQSHVKFVQCDVTEYLPFPDGYFDIAFSSAFLHNLKNSDKEVVLREAYRVLKHDGFILIIDVLFRDKNERKTFSSPTTFFKAIDNLKISNMNNAIKEYIKKQIVDPKCFYSIEMTINQEWPITLKQLQQMAGEAGFVGKFVDNCWLWLNVFLAHKSMNTGVVL